MAVNKVVYDGNTLIDLTGDTVTAADVASGVTFHLPDGTQGTGTASGGGSSTVATTTVTPSSNATSISFTVEGEPKSFSVMLGAQITLSSTRYVMGVQSDGTNTYGIYGYKSSGGGSSAYCYYSASYFSYTYSNGTLTVKSNSSTNGGYFRSGYAYRLIYEY